MSKDRTKTVVTDVTLFQVDEDEVQEISPEINQVDSEEEKNDWDFPANPPIFKTKKALKRVHSI